MSMGPRTGYVTLALLAQAIGCSSSDTTPSTNTRATAVLVDPAEFLGALPCGAIEGAPRSYIATVFDVTEATPTAVGESSRVSCGTPVAFTNIEDDHLYAADIAVFDAPPGVAVDGPAWTTTCAQGEGHPGAAKGRLLEQVTIHGCQALSGPGTATTGLLIDASAAAGDLGCVDDGGVVDAIAVVPLLPDTGDLPTVTIGCGQPAVELLTDIAPGERYTFELRGTDAAGQPSFLSQCEVTAYEGLVMPAACTQLSDRAELVFPVLALLEEEGLGCGSDVTKVRAALVAGPSNTPKTTLPCESDVTVEGVAAGPYIGSLELLSGSDVVLSYSCTGTAPPGATTTLVCTLED